MRIRPMSRSDRPAVKAMLEAAGVFSEEEVDVACELIDTYLDDPGQKDYIIDVCEGREGEVQGYVCWGRKALTEGVYDLYWVAVSPSSRRRGVGAALVRHVEAQILARGGRMLLVETSSTGPYDAARALYSRMGYSVVARVPDFYRVGDDLELYCKRLEPKRGRNRPASKNQDRPAKP